MNITKTIMFLVLYALTLPQLSAQEPPPDLDKIEAALKKTPNDPMLHYRKAQALFAQGKEQESITHAAIALTKFKAAKNNLAWMLLGSIKTEKHKIDVHYNMGAKERADKKDGIVRPYSFRIWTTDPDPKLVRIVDFELAYFDGKVVSAAIGQTSGSRHTNYGILDPKSEFPAVKKKVIDLVSK